MEGIPAPTATSVRYDAATQVQLHNYRFDLTRDELVNADEPWQLWAVFKHSIDMPDNSCRLIFTLDD